MGTDLEYMGQFKRGYGLWRKLEPHGGYSYWTDDIGGGRKIFDEGIDDWFLLFELYLIVKAK